MLTMEQIVSGYAGKQSTEYRRFCMNDTMSLLAESFEKIAGSVNTEIFELLHSGIALMSSEGNFLYCNKAFLDMFNLPPDILGKHITDYFLTGELGVMSTIRTRKMVICSSQTITNAKGISFRYPILDVKGNLRGVVVESISTSIGKDKLLALMDTVRSLELQANYYEQQETKKSADSAPLKESLAKVRR